MTVVMTLLVRDEADIVAANLVYHLSSGVDFAVVTDNCSIDGTVDILEEFRRDGSVQIIREPGDDFSQARWVTRMAELAYHEHGADWVLHCDADEFWWPLSGSIATSLANLESTVGAVAAARVNFLPTEHGEDDFAHRMTVREVRSLNYLGRPLPPKVCHRARAGVKITQGNHAVEGEGVTVGRGPSPFVILHYPLRTYEQFENKIAKGGEAYLRNQEVPRGLGKAWRLLYSEYQAGRLEAYYKSQILSPAETTAGIADGRLVVDRRLSTFLAPRRTPSRPERDGTRPGIVARGAVTPSASKSATNRPAGWHRDAVGGLWELLGHHQRNFLIESGLLPHHYLLDVGCGALRGGVRFVSYLQPGHYYGVDADEELLSAGRHELELAGLSDRGAVLRCDAEFNLAFPSRSFDYVLAYSLFTHLSIDSLVRCVTAVAQVLAPGGGFYATFFENRGAQNHIGGLPQPRWDGPPYVSYPDRDPYHYDLGSLKLALASTGLRLTYIGECGHPRNQKMLLFTHAASESGRTRFESGTGVAGACA